MTTQSWNPWKLTTLGLIVAIVVALVTGLVVANRTGFRAETEEPNRVSSLKGPSSQASAPAPRPQPAVRPQPAARPAPPPAVASAPATPTASAIEACNQYAANQVGPHDKTMEVVKDGLIGAAAGAAVGAAGGAIAGGGKGAGTGAAIGGLVGAGGGTLYGLNENRRHDERYRDAYAACMRARGYTAAR